ncbi:MAG: hypothetical protein KDD44_03575 [Bdellovibrionales bacterium]|nr:hypothetical protein [Bdellovibrionales bacterium]
MDELLIHPPFTGFPVALLTAAIVAEGIAKLLSTRNVGHAHVATLRWGSCYLVWLCALVSVVTYYSGYFSAAASSRGFEIPEDVVLRHQSFALAYSLSLVALVVLSVLRAGAPRENRIAVGFIGSLLLSWALAVYTSYLGGVLVFRHGAGVASQELAPSPGASVSN